MTSISQILDFINKNPWLNIVSISLASLGIFLSIWFHNKTKKVKRPSYGIRTINLVRENIKKIESVEILYHGHKIANLSVSRIAIWNAGRGTINDSDISPKDQFRIEIEKDNEIIDYELIYEKNQANGFSLVRLDERRIGVTFDYFDYNEGIIVRIYHTASDSDSLGIRGSFKGTKGILRNDSDSILATVIYEVAGNLIINPGLWRKALVIFTIILPILLLIRLFFDSELTSKEDLTLVEKIISFIYTMIIYAFVASKALRRRVPKGFNLFDSEF
ncbi:MAG: hypothetical protein AB2L20_12270 [Mangrovibacterium sp.]